MQMISKQKHVIVVLTIIAMLFSIIIPISGDTVDAAEKPALTVIDNSNNAKKEYTMAELENMAVSNLTYSSYNSYSSFVTESAVSGVNLVTLLTENGIYLSSLDEDRVIEFYSGQDSYVMSLTVKQLRETRYYYPNGHAGTEIGKIGGQAALVDAIEVPVIICVKNSAGKDFDGRLMIGQQQPNEQTNEAWVKYIAKNGKIVLTTKSARKLDPVTFSPSTNSVAWGTQITLANSTKKAKIYYGMDSVNPKETPSDIYNYRTSGGYAARDINVPLTFGEITVNAYASAYGYMDSDYSTKTYYSAFPNATSALKATAANYNTVNISWAARNDVDKVELYYATSKNGQYTLFPKADLANTYKHSNLKTGTTYYYKTVSYKDDIKGVDSPIVSVMPTLSKPAGVKAKLKSKKKIVITSKKVVGASGYVVYRSVKKSSGFKKIATVKKSSLKYTDKKVKKGKKYYYKVKAYRVVDGKKVYSAFSSRVNKKV